LAGQKPINHQTDDRFQQDFSHDFIDIIRGLLSSPKFIDTGDCQYPLQEKVYASGTSFLSNSLKKTKALLLVMVCDYICLRTFVSCWIWSSRCKCLRLSLACRREHQCGILDSMVLQLSCRSWLPPLLCQTRRSLRAHAWADSFWSAPAQTFKHEVPNTSYC